jgi:hypothetical protein
MVVLYLKELKYDGKSWKVPVRVTVPQKMLIAGQVTSIFKPSAGFAVLNIEITNPSPSSATVEIRDGDTVVKTTPVPAGGIVRQDNIVIKNELKVVSNVDVYVFVTGEDYQELIA